MGMGDRGGKKKKKKDVHQATKENLESPITLRLDEGTLHFHQRVDNLQVGDTHHHYHNVTEQTQEPNSSSGTGSVSREREIVAVISPAPVEDRATGVDGKILRNLQSLIATYHNGAKWKENIQLCQELVTCFAKQGADITHCRFDSIHFFVVVKTGADLEKLTLAVTDGTLARDLTTLLIPPELVIEAGCDLIVRLNFKETCVAKQKMAVRGTHKRPANIDDLKLMTSKEVHDWLRFDVGIPKKVVSNFCREGMDGNVLARYEEDHLKEDFKEIPKVMLRKILYARYDLTCKQATTESSLHVHTGPQPSNQNADCSTHQVLIQDKVDGTDTDALQNSLLITRHGDNESERSSTSTTTAHKVSLSKQNESIAEDKLRCLLTGDKLGIIDGSFYPLLVVNRPSDGAVDKAMVSTDSLEFFSLINWNAVFDCDSKSLENGVCSIVREVKDLKLLLPDTFGKDLSPEELEFNDVPSWVFVNGRADLEELEPPRTGFEWNETYGNSMDRAVEFFAATNIPRKRAVVLFLLLSDDSLNIMIHIFEKLQSSLRGHGRFAFVVPNTELCNKWKHELENRHLLHKDDFDKCSLAGISLSRINCYMKRMSTGDIRPINLPMKEGSCVVPFTTRSKWRNIDILPENECENVSLEEDEQVFHEFARGKELEFYKGNVVDWWNFFLTDKDDPTNNQVLKRACGKKLSTLVDMKLKQEPGLLSSSVVTITVFHEPGSGGTTIARQVLWDYHRLIRCITVRRAIIPTVKDILEVRRVGYSDKERDIPPVMALLDNMDEDDVLDLICALEKDPTAKDEDGLACIIIHCKRTSNPVEMADMNGPHSIVVQHKLTTGERMWFEDKFQQYKDKYSQEPEQLIGFMVMKEECKPQYIERIVKNIILDVRPEEVTLLKYIAVINKFMENFDMPVSCCDDFMYNEEVSKSRQFEQPWDKLLSNAINLLLIKTTVFTRQGASKCTRIVNSVLAAEVVKQLVMDKGDSVGEVVLDFVVKSAVLEVSSYLKKYIWRQIQQLLIRRRRETEDGDVKKSKFSPLVKFLLSNEKDMIFKILHEIVHTGDVMSAPIAQLGARLYLEIKAYPDATNFADMALGFAPNNSFYLDTKGRVIIDQIYQYLSHNGAGPGTDHGNTEDLVKLMQGGLKVFRSCQKASESEHNQRQNLAGYYGELKVIFCFLRVLESKVEPFCLHASPELLRKYLLTDEIVDGLQEEWRIERTRLRGLGDRVEAALGHLSDMYTFCKEVPDEDERCFEKLLPSFQKEAKRYFSVNEENELSMSLQQSQHAQCRLRRSVVKSMIQPTLKDVFDQDEKTLKRIQDLLSLNKPQDLFDLKVLIYVNFALAPMIRTEKQEESFKTVQHLVHRLRADHPNSLYGAFFCVLLSWANKDHHVTPMTNKTTTLQAVRDLNFMWKVMARSNSQTMESSPVDRALPRNGYQVKPRTIFFLTKGKGLEAFVHIDKLHAASYEIERKDSKIWQSAGITDKLMKLEGIIKDKDYIEYVTPTKEHVLIRLHDRQHCQPSNDRASFFLGFSLAGPLAYGLQFPHEPYKAREDLSRVDRRETVPGYLLVSSRCEGGGTLIPAQQNTLY